MMEEKNFNIGLLFILCSQGVISLEQAVSAAEIIIDSHNSHPSS